MPRVEEVLEAVGKSAVISKMDLSKGYYQVPMREEDIGKWPLYVIGGHVEFTRMPFGVKSAPAALMRKVLDGCRDFARPYMDDIYIFSGNWE